MIIQPVLRPIAIVLWSVALLSPGVRGQTPEGQESEATKQQAEAPAPTLPLTIKNVVYSPKASGATSLFGSTRQPGTLVVDAGHIEYKAGRQVLVVPTAQMLSVKREVLGSQATQRWIVVEYRDGADTKIAAFQPSAFRGQYDLDGLERALRYVFDHRQP